MTTEIAMQPLQRMLVLGVVYTLSLPAFLLSFIGWVESFGDKNPTAWVCLVSWPIAWGLHLVLSFGWLLRKPLPKWVVVAGASCGVMGLLAMPLAVLFSPSGAGALLPALAGVVPLQLVLVSPALALAVAASKFHWRGTASSLDSLS